MISLSVRQNLMSKEEEIGIRIETLADIRNKLTTPIVVLEKISKGGQVPEKTAGLALRSLKDAISLLDEE